MGPGRAGGQAEELRAPRCGNLQLVVVCLSVYLSVCPQHPAVTAQGSAKLLQCTGHGDTASWALLPVGLHHTTSTLPLEMAPLRHATASSPAAKQVLFLHTATCKGTGKCPATCTKHTATRFGLRWTRVLGLGHPITRPGPSGETHE